MESEHGVNGADAQHGECGQRHGERPLPDHIEFPVAPVVGPSGKCLGCVRDVVDVHSQL